MAKYDMKTDGTKAESEAKAVIERNGGKVGGNTIRITNPGIKVLAAIDYLVNYRKYTWNKNA